MRWVGRHIRLTRPFQGNFQVTVVEDKEKSYAQPFALTFVSVKERIENEATNFRFNAMPLIYRHCQLSRGLCQ